MVASDLGVKEIELIIKSSEDMSQKRKKSMRKRSSMKQNSEFTIKPKSMSSSNENDTYANDMMCDYDYFGDTRNRKVGMEEGKWSNQCTNFKDDKRIYYIKKKKEQQRLEQMAKISGEVIEEEDEYSGKKKNKRQLKEHNKIYDDTMSIDSMENEGKKGKKKGKKNKH